MAIRFTESSEANREDWRGGTGSLMPMSASRYASCAYAVLLVEVWVILDWPLKNPLLPKEETNLHQLFTKTKMMCFKQHADDKP